MKLEYARFADDLVILIDAHRRHDWLIGAVNKRLREEFDKTARPRVCSLYGPAVTHGAGRSRWTCSHSEATKFSVRPPNSIARIRHGLDGPTVAPAGWA